MTAALVYSFACPIPAGTAIATPATTNLTMPEYVVEWIEWTAPSGWNGMVGFYFAHLGNQALPFASGAPNWIITNNDHRHWDLTDQTDSGAWQLVGYNLGTFPHTLYVQFGLSVPASVAASTALIVPNSALSG